MTPQQEALQNQVIELPVIKKLQESDETLYSECVKLEEGQKHLEEGQNNINNRLDKGAERMDGMEQEMKSIKDALTSGLKDVIAEIKDTKISELKKDLSDRKSSDNGLKNDLIKILVLTVIGVLGYLFTKAY